MGPIAPHRPADTATSLELVYRLCLSPIGNACWQRALAPADQGGRRTELWHTRLAERVKDQPVEDGSPAPILRAIWSPDHGSDDAYKGFEMAIEPRQRSKIVDFTSGFTEMTASEILDNAWITFVRAYS